jgi:beta-lactamase regulating signal transducer with metallopeptidase domain
MSPSSLSALWTAGARELCNHLWQSTAFAGLVALLALALRRYQARTRYWLWIVASAKFLVPFSLLIALGSHLAPPNRPTGLQAGVYFAVDQVSQPFAEVSTPEVLMIPAPGQPTRPDPPTSLLPGLLAGIWLVGFVVVLVSWYVQWRRVASVMRKAEPLREDREVRTLRRVEQVAKAKRPLQVFSSHSSMEPGVFGFFRPVLLWPEGISRHLDDSQLEAVLAHEVCHVKRRDNLTSVVHMIVEALFWFHPLVWWIEKKLVEERELACDEEVLRLCDQPHVYAASILKICEFSVESPLPCVSGITSSDLKKRILNILANRVARELDLCGKLLLLVAALLALAAPIVAGQVSAAPRTPVGVPRTIDIPPEHGLPDYAAELQKTYSLLAAAQVAVFPIGAGGLGEFPNPIAPGSVGPGSKEFAEIELSFESMAEATGGTAFYNSNDLASLVSQAVDKGANYYTLTYSPPGQKYNNAHHTIKVSVDRPDLHLVYRQSYDAVDPTTIKPTPGLTLATTLSDTTPTGGPSNPEAEMRFAMGRSMPTSQQILFDVKVEPSTEPPKPTDPPTFGALDPKLKNKPLTRYGFQFAIPGRQIVFTDGTNATRLASLEFDLAAYDADGKLINSLSQSIKLPLTTDQAQQLIHSPFRFFQQLDLPTGQIFLRIGVLDQTSTKIGTLEIPLLVGKHTTEPKTNKETPEVKKNDR